MKVICPRSDCSVMVSVTPLAGGQSEIEYLTPLEVGCPLRRPKVGESVPLLAGNYSCPNLDEAIDAAS
jgi:hypothetical protein